MKIRFQRNMLYLNNNRIFLDNPIYGLIELDDIALVLIYGFSSEQMETLPARNVYAFNEKGEKVWEIEAPYQDSNGIVSYADISLRKDGKIVAGSTRGDEYIVNVNDGSVEHIKGRRPW